MAEVVANGVRFHVQRLGDGPRTVVMIHGMVMDNLSSWWYTIANPVAQHANVLLYDLRGHGRSERPPTGYRIRDAVADLEGLLDATGVEAPVDLVGNSYGGTVALGLALRAPERVRSMVLIEAHFAVDGWGERMAGSLELAGLGLDEDGVRAWLEVQGGRKLNRMAAKAEALIYETTLVEDMRTSPPFREDELADLAVPTLALYGEHSDVIDRAHDLGRCLPDVDLRIYADNSHSVLMDSTNRVREDVLAWLRRCDATATAGVSVRDPLGSRA
jgi:pimeloyl-ACP methyl ester carboxylesterase